MSGSVSRSAVQSIVITGASTGLGAALAEQYASPTSRLFLCARQLERLETVAKACREKGAFVDTALVDITQPEQLEKWANNITNEGKIDLLIANAGVFHGHRQVERESAEEVRLQIETNLRGTIDTVNAFLPHFLKNQHGHVAIISSLAAIYPLADAPSYSASKAGLFAYAQALREELIGSRLDISVILPGHIETAQTQKHRGKLPRLLLSVEAAKIIVKQLKNKRFLIAFPKITYWLIRLSVLLPWRFKVWINRAERFYVDEK